MTQRGTGIFAVLDTLEKPLSALPVLLYLEAHSTTSPTEGCRDLHIGVRTWYQSIQDLEAYGLVAVSRSGRSRRASSVLVTRKGRRLLESVQALSSFLSSSVAEVEREIAGPGTVSGSEHTGDLLCRLVEHAERTGDVRALGAVASRANSLSRAGEAMLARTGELLHLGDVEGAAAYSSRAIETLGGNPGSRSYRRALLQRCAVLDLMGQESALHREALRLRALAREASDLSHQAEAQLVLGLNKARRRHERDARLAWERAINLARFAGCAEAESKGLANLALLAWPQDSREGASLGRQALTAARETGNGLLVARAKLGMALMAAGDGAERVANLEAASALACGGASNAMWTAGASAWVRKVHAAGVAFRVMGGHRGSAPVVASALCLVRTGPTVLGAPPSSRWVTPPQALGAPAAPVEADPALASAPADWA